MRTDRSRIATEKARKSRGKERNRGNKYKRRIVGQPDGELSRGLTTPVKIFFTTLSPGAGAGRPEPRLLTVELRAEFAKFRH